MRKDTIKSTPTLILALLSTALGALAVFALFLFAHQSDSAARAREEALLDNGVVARVAELGRMTESDALWDEAVVHLVNSFDRAWAEENIGKFFFETKGFDQAAVLDGADAPIYAMVGGETVDPALAGSLATAAQPLVRQVRNAERTRGPLDAHFAAKGAVTTPIYRSAFVRHGDKVYVATAALVQPHTTAVAPRSQQSAIMLTAKAVDQAFLAPLADRFLLDDPDVVTPGMPLAPGRARIKLKEDAGAALMAVDWQPRQPGSDLLAVALPVALCVLAGMGLLVWALYRHDRKATGNLLASEARATHLAYHDGLTGLPNRLMLAERLQRANAALRQTGAAFAVHCIDLDRFKEVNDTFGHETGDELVRAVAGRLASRLPEGCTLARLGGDEFALLHPDADLGGAETLARALVALMSEPVELSVGRVHLGASIGVALVDDPLLDGQECLRRADLALYRAKDAGRGRHMVFADEMDASMRQRALIRDDLRAALAGDQLQLVYQPQVHDGEIYGVEALLRWTHPERGPVSPAVFIPIAEESGLIEAIGRFTLREAFQTSHRLPGLRIAVNVSAVQVRARDFVAQLAGLLSQTGADPGRFELEITEGLLLGDDPAIRQTLQGMRDLGFRIALDDFGTGYSSLSYLQRYPIDKIKIDRSFITNLGADKSADAVVSAIVRLARALRLDVIAEGVETETQLLRLRAAGCGDVQGYLCGRPMPFDQLVQCLASPPAPPVPAERAEARRRAVS